MGSKLAILAAVALTASSARLARADNAGLARQLFELAIEEYKTKQYDAAIVSLTKSYALDPKPDVLYALAQAERLAGKCTDAVAHYEQLLATTTDDKTSKAVQANIELCKQIDAGKAPPPESTVPSAEVAQRDAPTIEYRTVVRTERRTDALMVGSFIGGGVLAGGSAALYLIGRSARSSAERAQTLDDYNELYDRSRTLKTASYVTLGASVALVGFGVYRLVRGGNSGAATEPRVALIPLERGSMLSLGGRF
jgi:tetratricopeptide (TPR) repeat protein